MLLLFANNASTTLASAIAAGATTIPLATGSGALFPNPSAGQQFYMTITDAATQSLREIVVCTSRTGDVCTVARAQQGTTARAWGAGDLIAQLWTAGDLQAAVQTDQLQGNLYTATNATGTNSITAALPSGLTALPDSMVVILRAAGANTGVVTLTLTIGTTVLPAHAVVKYGGSALQANDIPAAGYPCWLVWSNTLGAYVMINPASGVAGSISGGSANQVLYQSAPGVTSKLTAPTIAGQVLAWTGSALAWLAAAVTSFNGRSGAVTSQAGDYNAGQVGAVDVASFMAPNQSLANPGFISLPNGASPGAGLTFQVGNRSISPNVATTVTFGKIFPNICLGVVVSCNNQSSAIRVDGFTPSSFNVQVNATNITWIAFGY